MTNKYKAGDIVEVNGHKLTIVRPQIWPNHVEYLVKESLVHLFEDEDGNLYTDKPAFLGGFDGMVIL